MKRLITTVAVLLMVPALAPAQDADQQYRAEFYLFGAYERAVGGAGGGGGEVFIAKGLGVGGEFAHGSPFGEYMLSANLYYGLPSTSKKRFEPFVTGGYSRLSVDNLGPPPVNGANFGAGANVWLKERVALRLEVRDTIGGRSLSIDYEPYGNFYTAPNKVVSFRIGITFR